MLVNNAGVYGPRERTLTEDGYEVTFATNHLGGFAFTGLVLDRLLPVPGSRVVTLSSLAHLLAGLDLDDLQTEHRYRRHRAYGRSKLANLLFTAELQRRLNAAGGPTASVAAHLGQSRTEFTRDLGPVGRLVYGPRTRPLTGWMLQDRRVGALAQVRAAVDLTVRGGDCYGPAAHLQLTGHPVPVRTSTRAHDASTQRRLWAKSEQLTGVTYPLAEARV